MWRTPAATASRTNSTFSPVRRFVPKPMRGTSAPASCTVRGISDQILTTSLPVFLPSNSMLIATGSCSNPSTTVSCALSLPSAIQPAELRDGLGGPAEVVEHDEALEVDPLDQEVAEVARAGRDGRRVVVVAGDQPAQRPRAR